MIRKKLVTIDRPYILGLHLGHDAAIALCSSSGVVFSIAEERLSRIKHCSGFPENALNYLFNKLGVRSEEIAGVAFGASHPYFPAHSNILRIDYAVTELRASHQKFELPPHWRAFTQRHWSRHQESLARLGLADSRLPHYYVHHHRAHASSAFRLSGMSSAAILTMDGRGDGLCSLIARGNSDGSMQVLRRSDEKDSIGSLFQAVTEALGFVPVDGEYKTMGLAALGEGRSIHRLADYIDVDDGVLRSKLSWSYRDYNAQPSARRVPNPLESVSEADHFRSLLGNMSAIELAEAAQSLAERIITEMASAAISLSGESRLVAAGGVMLNVKANYQICKKLGLSPSDFFVFPDAADSGLAVGAALEVLHHDGAIRAPLSLTTPFLGPSFEEGEIESAFAPFEDRLAISRPGSIAREVALLLAQGQVIGSFQGRMEIGPRALGNRSVLADPRDPKVKDRINLLLKGREPFVPFAPVILDDEADKYFIANPSYKYMTVAVPATQHAKVVVPGVVHVDGSMRPEIVSIELNPYLHGVLTEFRSITGIGVLINTSFNRHGLPMVGRPVDAIEHLLQGWVDKLAIGGFLVERRFK
jgi:carbamoyltransferase